MPKSAWLTSICQAIFKDGQKILQIRFTRGRWEVKVVPKEEVDDWFRSLGWRRRVSGKEVYAALADVDGDKRLDRIEWDFKKRKLMVNTNKGVEWVQQVEGRWAVKDLDGDGKAELIGENLTGRGNWWLIVCWHFDPKEKKWKSDSVKMPFEWWRGDLLCEFCLESNFAVRYRKGFALIGFTRQQQRTQIWKLIWQGDKWQKELIDEFEREGEPIFVGRGWLALIRLKPSQQWLWVRGKVNELLQRLNLHGLPEIDPTVKLIGRIGKGKWVTLTMFKESQWVEGWIFTDLDGDGLQEIALVLRQPNGYWAYVGKFVSGQWWVRREKFPDDFVLDHGWGIDFRHDGFKWFLWQDINNRCVAMTVRQR